MSKDPAQIAQLFPARDQAQPGQITFEQVQALYRYIKEHCPQITAFALKANGYMQIFGSMSIVGSPLVNRDLAALTQQQADHIVDLENQLYAIGLNPDVNYCADDLAAIRTIIAGVLVEGVQE